MVRFGDLIQRPQDSAVQVGRIYHPFAGFGRETPAFLADEAEVAAWVIEDVVVDM
jgi:hypothetical protein